VQHLVVMPSYAEQVAEDADRLQRSTGLTHEQYMVALSLLIVSQLREAESLLDQYQLTKPCRFGCNCEPSKTCPARR
jgi:hypothetical protein